METLFNNKKFIWVSIILVTLLSLFVLVLFINEIKSSDYIGRSTQPQATITVSGKGEMTAVPDIATLSFSITKDAATTKEAQSALNESLKKVLDYLKSQKIDDKDIKSEYGGVNPKYSYYEAVACYSYPCPQKDPKITGYTATQSIEVKIRAVDTANDIRTGLANISITNISGPNFSIDNKDKLLDEARSKAISDAREKAKILAKDLHVRLGKMVSYNEGGENIYPMMYSKATAGMDMISSREIAPELPKGENKITSTVTIIYEIK